MADAAVRFDVFEAADVAGDKAAKFALNDEFLDRFAERAFVLRGEVFWLRARIDLKLFEDILRTRAADTINRRETDLKALFVRDCDTCDAKHKLSLSLFVSRISANNPQRAATAHVLALQTDFLD